MRNIRARKAFTLIELIVVIIIIGILAALAVVAYKAVINRAEDQTALTTARSAARELQALAAFEAHPSVDVDNDKHLNRWASELNADLAGAGGTAAAVADVGITVTANGQDFCLSTAGLKTGDVAQSTIEPDAGECEA